MNAYRCDVCKQVYLLPVDHISGEFDMSIPMTIYTSNRDDPFPSTDVCASCAKKIETFITMISQGAEVEYHLPEKELKTESPGYVNAGIKFLDN